MISFGRPNWQAALRKVETTMNKALKQKNEKREKKTWNKYRQPQHCVVLFQYKIVAFL